MNLLQTFTGDPTDAKALPAGQITAQGVLPTAEAASGSLAGLKDFLDSGTCQGAD
jgi:hypothetical protein